MSRAFTFTNWARTYSSTPESYHQPDSEAAIIALVKQAVKEQKRIRVVGAGHSWSPIALTNQLMLNLDRYNKVLNINKETLQITVQGGIRLKTLNAVLEQNGMALANLGSISEQSIAGAISTGTHGTGITLGLLASQVVGLSLINGVGEVVKMGAEQGEHWRAAMVGLGCLGIISTVTLQCVKAYNLEEKAYPLPFEDTLDQLPQLIKDNRHLKLWWFPHAPFVQVYAYNITDRPPSGHNTFARRLDESFLSQHFFNFLLGTGMRFPKATPRINRLINRIKFKKEHRIDTSYRVLNVPMPPRHRESEYAIAATDAVAALRDMKAMIDEGGLMINFVVEVRFVKGDNYLLSPAHGRDTCYLGAYKAGDKGWWEYLAAFETLMQRYSGRPHWGKEYTLDHKQFKVLYPEMPMFNRIRKELDPQGIFLNKLVEESLG